jgi:hypothetical protein
MASKRLQKTLTVRGPRLQRTKSIPKSIIYSNATPNERNYQRTKSIPKIISRDDSRNERLE